MTSLIERSFGSDRALFEDVKEPDLEPLSYKEAAAQILEMYGNHKPMHYREILKWAVKEGLIRPSGDTPERSMSRALTTNIIGDPLNPNQGAPFFRDVWREGYYGLAEWRKSGIQQATERNRKYVHTRIIKGLTALEDTKFVVVVRVLLGEMGFSNIPPEPDIKRGTAMFDASLEMFLPTGQPHSVPHRVHVYTSSHPIAPRHVQQMSQHIGRNRAQGLIVSRGGVGNMAVNAASKAKRPVVLLCGDKLGHMFMEFGVGAFSRNENLFGYLGFEGVRQ